MSNSSFLGIGQVNWNEVEETGFKPLPAGTYGAKITSAEISENKAKNGKYVKLELSLLGGKGIKGRRVFDYLTIAHPNEEVVKIALGRLKKLIKLVDKDPDTMSDTSELVNNLIGVVLKLQNDETYGQQNKVAGFEKFNEDLLNKTLENDDVPF